MKRTLPLLAAVAALVAATLATWPAPAAVDELFSPQDDLQAVWVAHIEAARHSVHVAAFGVSNRTIAAALEAAARRRVQVCILEDRTQAHQSEDLHGALAAAGCRIIVKRSGLLLHDKMGDFDAGTPAAAALVGSYNLSHSAERQDNSLVVFDGEPGAVAKVEDAWRRMFKREIGRDFTPPGVAALPPVTDPDARQGERDQTPTRTRPREGRMFLLNRAAVAPTPATPGQVWVNLTTRVYHLPGNRYYGKTANGRYMSEADALKAGYRKAGNE